MLRFIIIAVLCVLFLILSLPLLGIEWIIGKINPGAKDRSSLAIVKGVFRFVVFLSGTKVTVKGLENLPTDRSVLYIGNHRSYFDIIINYIYMPGLTGFVAKKETSKIPSFRVWMKYAKCLFLDRDDIKQGLQTILSAIEYVKQGISIFIFPEGTRNKTDEALLPFKAGSFKIATKSGCDIIPVSINNTSAIFEDHMPIIRKTHVIIEYGKPISVKDLSRDELKALPDTVRDNILYMYEQNKAAV